jgi:hypothetical protein
MNYDDLKLVRGAAVSLQLQAAQLGLATEEPEVILAVAADVQAADADIATGDEFAAEANSISGANAKASARLRDKAVAHFERACSRVARWAELRSAVRG